MKTMKTVSMRLDEQTLKRTAKLAAVEQVDTATALRQSVRWGLDALSREQAVAQYAKGTFSLAEAADFANVSVGEMVELLVRAGVKANYSLADAELSAKLAGTVFRKSGEKHI